MDLLMDNSEFTVNVEIAYSSHSFSPIKVIMTKMLQWPLLIVALVESPCHFSVSRETFVSIHELAFN